MLLLWQLGKKLLHLPTELTLTTLKSKPLKCKWASSDVNEEP